jgi:MerR family transcriptional regulator, copper efflux regulator
MATDEALSARYRIAEIAELSGFTPSALRYYEQAGVLPPPERTAGGYRTYGTRDLERLQLIARAKELGCTLEEIADLVEAWDDDRCGPVKHRLRSLVQVKFTEVERHLTEQAAFAVQLEATAALLANRPVDGPCDDTCGCTSAGPHAEPDAPAIACSLSGDDLGDRVAGWRAVLAGVGRRERLPGGVRLELGAGVSLSEIVTLAEAEQRCCPFFTFTLTIDDRGAGLEVTAPPDGQDLLATVFGAPS